MQIKLQEKKYTTRFFPVYFSLPRTVTQECEEADAAEGITYNFPVVYMRIKTSLGEAGALITSKGTARRAADQGRRRVRV